MSTLLNTFLLNKNLFLSIRMMLYSVRYSSPYKTKVFIRKVLQDHLNLSEKTIINFMRKEPSIIDISEKQIIQTVNVLKENNVRLHKIEQYGSVLCIKPAELKHKIYLLEELGAKDVNLAMLANYARFLSLPPVFFKAHLNIGKEVSLVENLYSQLKDSPDIPPDISDDISVNDYCQICLKHYLTWKLNIVECDEVQLLRSCRMPYKSFRLTESVIKIILDDFKLPSHKMKKCLKMVVNTPENIISIHSKLDSMSMDLPYIIEQCPKLLLSDINDLNEIINYMQVKGISPQTIKQWPSVLLMKTNEFKRRLDILLSYPELKVFFNHPKLLKLIQNFRLVEVRLKYMKEFSRKLSSLRLLTGKHSTFQLEMKHKTDINDIIDLLNKDFKKDEAELKKLIKKHPFWKYCSLIQVQNTFEYLKKHFSLDDIYKNLYAVFYPSDNINKILQDLKIKYSNIRDSSCTPIPYLALCIYKMELDHHFSGDGVWTQENQKI